MTVPELCGGCLNKLLNPEPTPYDLASLEGSSGEAGEGWLHRQNLKNTAFFLYPAARGLAALPRNYQQVCNNLYSPPGRRGRRPLQAFFLFLTLFFMLNQTQVPLGPGRPAPLYSPSRAQHFPQKSPIFHPAAGQFSTSAAFFADNFSCLRSVFHHRRKAIQRYFVIYSCAILQL